MLPGHPLMHVIDTTEVANKFVNALWPSKD